MVREDYAVASVLPSLFCSQFPVRWGTTPIARAPAALTEQSIGMTLAVRNLMTDLRSSGEVTGGPKSFAPRDRSTFLSELDQTIRRIQRQRADQPVSKQN